MPELKARPTTPKPRSHKKKKMKKLKLIFLLWKAFNKPSLIKKMIPYRYKVNNSNSMDYSNSLKLPKTFWILKKDSFVWLKIFWNEEEIIGWKVSSWNKDPKKWMIFSLNTPIVINPKKIPDAMNLMSNPPLKVNLKKKNNIKLKRRLKKFWKNCLFCWMRARKRMMKVKKITLWMILSKKPKDSLLPANLVTI